MSAQRKRFPIRDALELALLASLLSLASARAGAAEQPSQPPAAEVARQPGRPDSSRVGEPLSLVELQRRLDSINAAGTAECLSVYTAHKAQAWVNFGKYAAAEHLPAATQAAALQNATRLVGSLEQHESAALDTPELPGARHVRDDLWRGIAAVKGDGRLCAAPRMTAYCEVQLAWASYEAGAGGWRHVDPYIRIAEDYCSSAIAALPATVSSSHAARELTAAAPGESSATPRAAPLSAPPTETPTPLPAPAMGQGDPSLSVVFPHNRATRADIRSPGRAEIRRLGKRLKSMPQNTIIMVVGHADLTGKLDYNLKLSLQRARSVATELRVLGVHARIRLAARGSSEPVVECPTNDEVAERRRYLACLEPNRRVTIHLITNPPQQASTGR